METLKCIGVIACFVGILAIFTRYHDYFDRFMDKWYALCRKGR